MNEPDYELEDAFLDGEAASLLKQELIGTIDWETDAQDTGKIARFGIGEATVPGALAELFELLGRALGTTPDSCVLHFAPSGQTRSAFDSGSPIAPDPAPHLATAIISLDSERDLTFSHKEAPTKTTAPLPHGSLLCVMPRTEQHWDHELETASDDSPGRLSLTFRSAQPTTGSTAGGDDPDRITIGEDFSFQFAKPGAPSEHAPFQIAVHAGDQWLGVGAAILLPTACRIASEVCDACPGFDVAILDHAGRRVV